jgi:DNA-binding XRE family transcriptional regulator
VNEIPLEFHFTPLPLDGRRYAIVSEARLRWLCRKAGVQPIPSVSRTGSDTSLALFAENDDVIAARLARRRREAGLSQAALARLAGVRVETLNRVERGHTTPDFKTVRKLVLALREAERGAAG